MPRVKSLIIFFFYWGGGIKVCQLLFQNPKIMILIIGARVSGRLQQRRDARRLCRRPGAPLRVSSWVLRAEVCHFKIFIYYLNLETFYKKKINI